MTARLVPIVVDSVQDGVASELGGTAAEVVDVVVLEGDLVVRASEVQVPVVITVARSTVITLTIDVRIGYANTARGILTQDDVLTADGIGGDVVLEEVNLGKPKGGEGASLRSRSGRCRPG